MSDLSVDKIKNFPRDNPKARLYLCKRVSVGFSPL